MSPARPEPLLSSPLKGTGPGASSPSSKLVLLRNAHVYPAVCISHKVALDRDMIPPPPPGSHLLGSFQTLVEIPSYFWGGVDRSESKQ